MRLLLSVTLLTLTAGAATASPVDLATATGLFTPTFRGEANTTYLGWDVFGEPGDALLNDTTPDVGSGGGSFVTTNGEDHQSGSLNYYSGFGSVAEEVTFDTDGVDGSGFTTVIVQAQTLFGGWGSELVFGPIDGVLPTQVLQATNAAGAGQLFAKYELAGVDGPQTFSISGGGFNSFDLFVVDSLWSADGFAPDFAIATPEPASAVIAFAAALPALLRRR